MTLYWWLCIDLHVWYHFVAVAKPRKTLSGSHTLQHNSSFGKVLGTKDVQKAKTTSTMPCSSSLTQQNLSQLKGTSQRSGEDDAYTTLHPSGTSTSTLNTGDSGFEDVRPLQRLDQEPDTTRDLAALDGMFEMPPLVYSHQCTLYSICFASPLTTWLVVNQQSLHRDVIVCGQNLYLPAAVLICHYVNW